MIAFFDLEGPLCPIDHAAEVITVIGKNLGKKEDFFQLFKMISQFDDELFLVDKKKNYWPGDTLKLIAPIIIAYANENLLKDISKNATLTNGAKELFHFLQQNNIPTYIISTSYSEHAYTIAEKLNQPIENVSCTKLNFSLKPKKVDFLDKLLYNIFPKYMEKGLAEVKKDLNTFFFYELPKTEFGEIFRSTVVCGGERKKEAIIKILKKNNLKGKDAFAIGDSITDVQMLEYIKAEGGQAISFNGNEHSLKPSSIAYSGKSILPLKELFKAYPNTKQFIQYKIKNEKEQMQHREEYFALIEGCTSVEFERILMLQKKYRRLIREKAGELT